MEHTLIIRHAGKDPDRFQIIRMKDGKGAPNSVGIPSPDVFPVEGRLNSNLSAELRWRLERFLDYPYHPDTDVAERVLDSLRRRCTPHLQWPITIRPPFKSAAGHSGFEFYI